MKLTIPFVWLGLVVALLIIIAPTESQADYRFMTRVVAERSQAQGQQQTTIDTTVMWLGKSKARTDMDQSTSFLVLADKNMMYTINHNQKQYVEIPVGYLKDMLAAKEKEDPEAAAQMRSMISMMDMKITVTKTDETKKIKDWNCRKYTAEMKMSMGGSSTEIWTTEDISVDHDLYATISNVMMAQLPGFKDALKEWKKIKGVTISSVTKASAMGGTQKITQDLLEFVEKDAPAGTFDIPEGYKKTELTMPGMR
ncbi:MAG: DUF4412 domain-containing protein [candidate division Zixibacteria bacterium]|nr:DUF4412 domain-containing protein [candidate division Zixibacteria bacterium]